MHVLQTRHRVWDLEGAFLILVGGALIYLGVIQHPHLSPIEDTIILVLFLGLLLGIAPIPFPKVKKLRLFPRIAGLLSGLMDSFLVLLMISVLPIIGKKKEVLSFKAAIMLAALIGGLLVYFGEVYALPHFIKYDIHSLWDTLYLAPPIVLFLGALSWYAHRLSVKIDYKKHTTYVEEDEEYLSKKSWENILEFFVGILLLLTTHNILLCLGVLLIYAFVSGQGNHLIGIWRNETEIGVMLLLLFAWLIFEPASGFFMQFDAWWQILLGSSVNAILSGALIPAGGDRPREIIYLSTGALVTPLSSLVGVMLFKTRGDRKSYMQISIPFSLLRLVLGITYITLFPLS